MLELQLISTEPSLEEGQVPHPYSSSLWVPLLSEGLWPSVCHLGCGMKVWARMLRGGQEKKAAKIQGNRGGEEKRRVGDTQQVGTETLP